jgi:hypothetical protein
MMANYYKETEILSALQRLIGGGEGEKEKVLQYLTQGDVENAGELALRPGFDARGLRGLINNNNKIEKDVKNAFIQFIDENFCYHCGGMVSGRRGQQPLHSIGDIEGEVFNDY